MPEEPQRYVTMNGQVPNGGIPPSRMFAAVAAPQPQYTAVDNGPPDGGFRAHMDAQTQAPPAYFAPPPVADGTGFYPYYPPPPTPQTLIPFPTPAPYPVQALPAPPPALALYSGLLATPPATWLTLTAAYPPAPPLIAPATSAPAPALYEPAGQWVDGQRLAGDGWSYLAPVEHATIHFVNDGCRPCDYPEGFPLHFDFIKLKVPTIMTVRELMAQLGCPPRPECGITEMIELGHDRWHRGDTFTTRSELSRRTLAEVGWTSGREKVWLVVMR